MSYKCNKFPLELKVYSISASVPLFPVLNISVIFSSQKIKSHHIKLWKWEANYPDKLSEFQRGPLGISKDGAAQWNFWLLALEQDRSAENNAVPLGLTTHLEVGTPLCYWGAWEGLWSLIAWVCYVWDLTCRWAKKSSKSLLLCTSVIAKLCLRSDNALKEAPSRIQCI